MSVDLAGMLKRYEAEDAQEKRARDELVRMGKGRGPIDVGAVAARIAGKVAPENIDVKELLHEFLVERSMKFGGAIDAFRSRHKALDINPSITDQDIAQGIHSLRVGLNSCESPLESAVLPWLIFENYGKLSTSPAVVHIPRLEMSMPQAGVVIVPQLGFARFRFDFALLARFEGRTAVVTIECDGATYHSDAKDATRDDYLEAWNIRTVRAGTGEIREYPGRAAHTAAATLLDMIG